MFDFLFRKLKGGWIPVIKFLRPDADRSLPPFLISSKIPSTVRRVLADSSAGLFWELGLLRLVIIIGTGLFWELGLLRLVIIIGTVEVGDHTYIVSFRLLVSAFIISLIAKPDVAGGDPEETPRKPLFLRS